MAQPRAKGALLGHYFSLTGEVRCVSEHSASPTVGATFKDPHFSLASSRALSHKQCDWKSVSRWEIVVRAQNRTSQQYVGPTNCLRLLDISGDPPTSHTGCLNGESPNWPTGNLSTLYTSSTHPCPETISLFKFPTAVRVSFPRQRGNTHRGLDQSCWSGRTTNLSIQYCHGKAKGCCQNLAWLCRVKRRHTSLRILPQCGARSMEWTYPYIKS